MADNATLLERLRAALDEIDYGVVVLDDRLHALLINRAFRRMWRLPDARADAAPTFADLIRHGRITGAYDVPADRMDAYIAERVAQVARGHVPPTEIRRSDGSILRFQCVLLPDDGRMILYMDVTKAVRAAEQARDRELSARRAEMNLIDAVNSLQDGFALYDRDDRLVLFNPNYRSTFGAAADAVRVGVTFEQLMRAMLKTGGFGEVEGRQSDGVIAQRKAQRGRGFGHIDVRYPDGRTFRVTDRRTSDGGTVTVLTDISDVRRAEDRLRTLTLTDPLTGVLNRRGFMEAARREVARARRKNSLCSIVMLDADRFKAINDTHGHDAGDRVLLAIATVCQSAVRASDAVGRIGGEEFALLLPDTPLDGATLLAERVREKLAAAEIDLDGTALRITASLGVAQTGADADDASPAAAVDDLLKRADAALYRAKNAGRNRVEAAPERVPRAR